jgi:hypothetical protein
MKGAGVRGGWAYLGCCGGRSCAGLGESDWPSIRSTSERRTSSFRCPGRVAGSRPRAIQSRTVAGLTRNSAATSASVSQGSCGGSGSCLAKGVSSSRATRLAQSA